MHPDLIAAPDLEVDPAAGSVHLSYADMLGRLGRPNRDPGEDGKVDVAWSFVGPGGGGFAVWNYKNGPAHLGFGFVDMVDDWTIAFSDDPGYRAENRDLAHRVFGPALHLEDP